MKPKILALHIFFGHVREILKINIFQVNFKFLKKAPIEMTPRGERRFFLTKTCETSANCQKSKIFFF